MDVVAEPEPPKAEPTPAPASPSPPEPATRAETGLEHEVRLASRNGRWALIAALCAAIVSGAVSAGSAIYVNTNQLDRSANLAAQQAVRSDRQKAYLDFLTACSDYLGQIGAVKGLLAAHSTDREALKTTINAAASRGGTALNSSLGVLLAGSHEMAEIVPKFATAVADFSGQHLTPFILRYLTTGGAGESDDAGMLRDEAALSAAIDKLIDQVGTVYTEVLDQARTDLGFV
ncbi:MAG TPA: hypothetical protein VF477_12185 [Mycobacterium sp.]